MRKVLLFAVPPLLATVVLIAFGLFLYRNSGKGALQVTSIPESEVFLDGKPLGKTPLCRCELSDMLSVGDYTIRLVPTSPDGAFTSFEQKMTIEKSVLTVVDRTFRAGLESEGSLITLRQLSDKKTAEMLVLSLPDQADVLLDSNPSGKTPTFLRNVTESDHTLTFAKDGYQEKELRVRTVLGYKLEAIAMLGIAQTEATRAAVAQSSPSATPVVARVVILNTPTGFLRVREKPTVASAEIDRVTPSTSFALLSEEAGWFQIRLPDGRSGWVSTQYARKEP